MSAHKPIANNNLNTVTILYVTVPDTNIANVIAKDLVGKKYAACVNILGPSQSVYRWNHKIEHSSEFILLVKTTQQNASRTKQFIEDIHPYDTPCVLALGIDPANSASAFANWVTENTSA